MRNIRRTKKITKSRRVFSEFYTIVYSKKIDKLQQKHHCVGLKNLFGIEGWVPYWLLKYTNL